MTFTLEANTLAAVHRVTDDAGAFVRQAVAEKLACAALADGLPLEGFNLDDLPDFYLDELGLPDFKLEALSLDGGA